MPEKHVFVSYAREDKGFAHDLRVRMKRSQINAWQDLNNLKAGQPWQDAIDNALRNAAALIVVMSPVAAASRYVTYEWAFAIGAGVPIIPVILAADTELHPRLSSLHCIDFTGRKPWVELWRALPIASRPNRVEIRARFELAGGAPKKDNDGYAVIVSLHGAPQNTRSVTYEVHDEGKEPLKWMVKNKETNFRVNLDTDGDVLVTATIRTDKSAKPVSSTLSDALRRGHRGTSRESVQRALQAIQEN
jgi:hypothetical protein